VLEIKNEGESSRDDNRDRRENTNRHMDGEDDIIRRIKIEPFTFDSFLDPKIFSDCMTDLDYYFDW